MTHHPTTVAVDLSMTVFEVGIADRQWRVGSVGNITAFRRVPACATIRQLAGADAA
jgi:hypothetical protein